MNTKNKITNSELEQVGGGFIPPYPPASSFGNKPVFDDSFDSNEEAEKTSNRNHDISNANPLA